MSFGPVERTPGGTFASVDHTDDPWDVLPVSMRRSAKQRIVAHASGKGLKTAEWARRAFDAALAAEEYSTSDCSSTNVAGR